MNDDLINQAVSNQYLTFFLGNEEYGVEILNVVEIRGMTHITPLPSAPNYVKGVINLRGTIIPVLDLRLQFNMDEKDYTEQTVVIVLQIQGNEEEKKRIVGIIVDAVSEVYTISGEELKSPPDIIYSVGKEYIKGLVSLEDEENKKMIIVIDILKLFDFHEIEKTVSDMQID